jgi:membrane protease YdiL (CAAX protease family)
VGIRPSRDSLGRALLGVVLGLGLVGFEDLVLTAGGHTHWVKGASVPSAATILVGCGGYLLLGLREELAFRGYPLRRLEGVWGMWPALLVLSGVFALEHVAGGWSWTRSLIGPAAGAMLFGMAALATRGIAVPLGIHAAFNAGQWLMGQKETPGIWRPVVAAGFDGKADAVGYAGYLAGTLVLAAGFYVWRWRASTRGTRGC